MWWRRPSGRSAGSKSVLLQHLRRLRPRLIRRCAGWRRHGFRDRGCLRRPHLDLRRPDRLDDVLIAGATAKVRRQQIEQILVADVRISLQRVNRQHQETRRAEAALQPVMRHECALHRMQRVALGQTLDGADRLSLRLHREHQAGAHRLVADDYRAGAAHAMLAADVRAGLAAVLADRIDQRFARLDVNGVVAAVDAKGDVNFIGHSKSYHFGRNAPNFPRTRSSTSWLARTTIGNVSRRPNGLQASMTTRALRGSLAP